MSEDNSPDKNVDNGLAENSINLPNLNENDVEIENVEEINQCVLNQNNIEDNANVKTKRKLPSWLSTSAEATHTKSDNRQKRRKNSNSKDLNLQNLSSLINDDVSVGASVASVSSECKIDSSSSSIQIKKEIKGESDADNEGKFEVEVKQDSKEEPSGASGNTKNEIKIKQEIKEEPIESNIPESSSNNEANEINASSYQNPGVVTREEASSTTRETCKFGLRCYRRNPMHKIEMAHPGDIDYKRPNYPPPPYGTPNCPFGDRCFRRNPFHFMDFSHPPSINIQKNQEERKRVLRARRKKAAKKDENLDFIVDDDDEEDDNPFSTDSDEDYTPSDDDSDD